METESFNKSYQIVPGVKTALEHTNLVQPLPIRKRQFF